MSAPPSWSGRRPSLRSPHAPHKAERESEQRESTSIRKYLIQKGGVQYIHVPVIPRACPRWPPASSSGGMATRSQPQLNSASSELVVQTIPCGCARSGPRASTTRWTRTAATPGTRAAARPGGGRRWGRPASGRRTWRSTSHGQSSHPFIHPCVFY